MLRSSLITASALLLCATASAQTNASQRLARVTAPVKDAGVYSLSTGTWTRNNSATQNFGDTIFLNDSQSGFFGIMYTSEEWMDEGRIPSTASSVQTTVGSHDGYTVDGWQFAYCTTQGPVGSANPDIINFFYEDYIPCTDPQAGGVTAVAGFLVPGVPASTACGTQTCWALTLDVENTTLEFCLGADGTDGSYDGTTGLGVIPNDAFAWSMAMTNNSCGFMGPILCGDPNLGNVGDGTIWSANSGPGTGVGIQDAFWIQTTDNAGTQVGPFGCFFFGGYPGNPHGSLWSAIYADLSEPDCAGTGPTSLGTAYCISLPGNNSGTPTVISATGSSSVATADATLQVSGAGAGLTGLFFYGLNQIQIPMPSADDLGFICTSPLQRLQPNVQTDAGGNASRLMLLQDTGQPEYGDITSAAPITVNHQFWHRDGMLNMISVTNTSNGIQINYTP